MHDTVLPQRTRSSAHIAALISAVPDAVTRPEALRSAARPTGFSDPMTEIFARQQRDLKHALKRAEFAERIMDNFLAHMSHEFRTPLNAIIGFSTLIRSGACTEPEQIQEYAAAIEIAGQQLHTMLSGILEFAALDAGGVSLAEDVIDLNAMLACCIENVRRQAGFDVEVSAALPADLPRLRGDRRRIRQVFDQILSNAAKFTPAKGKVRVSAAFTSNLVIEIADTGIGMTPAALEKAMRVFERVNDLPARAHGGAGIGLPLAVRLVELHDGAVSVETAPGIGTRVSIALPIERLVPADAGGF